MSRMLRWACFLLLSVVTLLIAPREAQAYPWMIRDGYTGCATCHADPSGGGLLTAYGRAESERLLSFAPREKDKSPSRSSEALFGLLPEPEGLLYSFGYRAALFGTKTEEQPASGRVILMQADARAQLTVAKRLRFNASVGIVPFGGQLAAIVPDSRIQAVSREHWVGIDLGERGDTLLRAGRIALPYGLRGNEHPMWIRTGARTDIASHQQHGLAVARTTQRSRFEALAILGNYQTGPDLYRERGYALFYEHVLQRGLTLGASSLVTHARGDLFRSRRKPITRQAHGLFARARLSNSVVLAGQADLVTRHPSGRDDEIGAVGMLQADVQIVRGFHVLPAAETQKLRFDKDETSYGAWLSFAAFPYTHTEIRLDLVGRSVGTPVGSVTNGTGLLSWHLYL